jgi:AcrR family transcriptional regulator
VSELADRHWRSDAHANHKALLSAATQLFGERGAEVTYEEIAQRAGVGRATLYRHFPHREDLLAAILDSVLDHLQEISDRLPVDETRLLALFHACVQLQEQTVPFIDVVSRSTPDATRRRIRDRFDNLFADPLRDAQAAGVVRGDLSPGDVRVVVMMLSALADAGRPDDRARARAIELAEAMLRTGA